MWSTDEEKRVSVDDFIGLLAFVGKAPAPDPVSMGLRNYFRGHMMDEAAAFKSALFAQQGGPFALRCKTILSRGLVIDSLLIVG